MSETIQADFADLPVQRDIKIRRGRTWEERFRISISVDGAEASALNMTEATSAKMLFEASDGTVQAVTLAAGDTSGNLTLALAATQTALLAAGRHAWELCLTFPAASTAFPDGAIISLLSGRAEVGDSIESE